MGDTEANADPENPQEPLLEAVARAEGDPHLFPDEVLKLHRHGQAARARKVLLQHAPTERDQARAANQRRLAGDLRLWLEPLRRAPSMYTVNGIGTRLHGRHQPAADGTYVGTLSFTFFYVPLVPLAAYLVQPAESGDGWHFLSRAPLPPAARRLRRLSGTVIAALLAVLGWNVYWSGAHTDLVVFNGFDRPVIAQLGERRTMVLARRHAVFEEVPLDTASIGVSWEDAAEPFERVPLSFAGRGRQMAIYNIADRALLSVEYVRYGEGEPPDGHWLERGPVLFLDERIDYLFATPPDTKNVKEGSYIEKSVLSAVDDGASAAAVASALYDAGRPEQALAVVQAELLVHPEDGGLAGFAARVLLRDDLAAQLALLRWCLERAPDAVDVHRAYQDIRQDERGDTLRREYAALLAAHPRSAMYHYLAGRLEPDGFEAAARHFRSALAIDPRYAPAYRALAYHALVLGRWADAAAQYDRFASLGRAEALEAFELRLRIRRRLGSPHAELERIIRETAALPDAPVGVTVMGAHYRLESQPQALAAEVRRIHAHIATSRGWDSTSAFAHNVHASLAITAGRPDQARAALRRIARPEGRSAAVALRLALTSGSRAEDLQVLLDIPGWQTEIGEGQRVAALGILPPDQHPQVIATLEPDVAGLARLLETPRALLDDDVVRRRVSALSLDLRAAVHDAFARALAGSPHPAAAAARRRYVSEARSLALPGELP